jgi:hypothetical protein
MKKVILAVATVSLLSNAYALTNEEFAKEVQRQIGLLQKDEKALKQASDFCSMLSSDRRRSEPRCIAAERVELLKMTGPSPVRIR